MATADGDRMIRVGFVPQRDWNEFMTRHPEQRLQHARVNNSPGSDLLLDHRLPLLRKYVLSEGFHRSSFALANAHIQSEDAILIAHGQQ